MDESRGEKLQNVLSQGRSRRRLLAFLSAVPLAGALAALNNEDGAARRRRKHKHKGKPKNNKKVVSAQISFTDSQLIPSGTQTQVQFNAIDADTRPSSVDLATSHLKAPFTGNYVVNARVTWN